MGRTACTDPQCLYSIAIPLLPLWTIRSVQSLSACTVELYLYSPYGPYGLYRPSVPVQYSYTSTPPMDRTVCTEPQCLYSTAIPLLPLWTVRSVQSLSACKRVHFTLPLPLTFEFVAEMLTNQDQGILTEVNQTFTRFSAIFSLQSLSPTLGHYLPEFKTVFPFHYLKYGCHRIITQSNYLPTETASNPRR